TPTRTSREARVSVSPTPTESRSPPHKNRAPAQKSRDPHASLVQLPFPPAVPPPPPSPATASNPAGDRSERASAMGLCSCCCRCLEILCAILLPPLGVCLRHGCCSMEFWISVLLTILGYLPGVLYAAYVICSVDPDRVRRRDDDYIYVA
uniref:Hydrophobic protein OSR8 n=6 Tax=Triticinae TaxID=1648030 RepID=A0A453QZ38_AEGTS